MMFNVTASEAQLAASAGTLPSLIDRAAAILVQARSSAEVLEARDVARDAYDAAKKAARLSKAKGAHDTLIAAAHRAQADALEIEAQAKRRLADEYDAAQERGEVASRGGERSGREHSPAAPTAADVGLSRKEIHEARAIRNAEAGHKITRRIFCFRHINFYRFHARNLVRDPVRSVIGASDRRNNDASTSTKTV